MNFMVFNLFLLAASFPALGILSIGLMVLLSPLAVFSKSERSPKAIVLPLSGIAALYQVYFWALWSAFCVALTYKYTLRPEVTWDWIYFVSGFMWCLALIGWLSHKERSLESHAGTLKKIGTLFYTIVAIVGFPVFAIWPNLMIVPFGWVLDLIGLTEYVAADPFLVSCPQPVPEFTLGPTSNPTEAEVTRLCDCIWGSLNSQEKDMARAIAGGGGGGGVSELDLRAFVSGFGRVVEQCGDTYL